jgi:hypothetical protein
MLLVSFIFVIACGLLSGSELMQCFHRLLYMHCYWISSYQEEEVWYRINRFNPTTL